MRDPATTTPADAPRRRPEATTPIVVAAALLFLPFVGAALAVVANTDVATMRTGDEAPFEARVLTLLDPPALLGPYSRHVWNHPGPFAFWLLGLPYLVLGRAPFVIQLAALALNAATLLSIARSIFVLARGTPARALGLVLAAILVAKTSATLDPSGLAVSWGPSCTLLPFAALVLLAAELGLGAWRIAPFVALLHAFVVQTHVLYFVPATLACAIGAVLAWRAAPDASSFAPSMRRLGAALGLLWAPVLADELFVSGNLERVVRFFVEERVGTPPDARGAAALFAWRASEPFRDLVGLGPAVARPDPLEQVGAAAHAVSGLALLGLIALVVRSVARPRDGAAPGGRVLGGLVVALLVLSAPTLLRVDQPEWPYLTWWIGALALLGGFGAGATLLPPRLDARGERIASIACLGAVTLVGLHTLGQISRESALGAERTRNDAEGIAELFPIVEHLYACRPETQLDVADEPLWGVLAVSIDHLGRAGTRAHVAPHWEFMFGPGYHGGRPDARVTIMGGDDHGCRAVDRGRWLRIGDCRDERGRPADRGASVALSITPWLARGVSGDPALLFDGVRSDEGAPSSAPGTLALAAGALVTFGVPPARLTRLVVTSDDDGVLRVEGSRDGRIWEPLADLEPTHQLGQRARAVDLPGGLVLRGLRVSPIDGDAAISEIEVDGEPASVRVVDAPGLVGSRTALTDGVSPEDGAPLEDPSAVIFEGDPASITVELPAFPVDGIALTADGHAFRVEASSDGSEFVEIGRIRAPLVRGLSTRRFYLDREILASHVRLTALPGEDGAVRIAELMPLRAPGGAVDIGLREAQPAMREGFSSHEGDEGWAWIVGRHAAVVVPWSEELPRSEGADVLVSLVPFVGLATPGTLTIQVGASSTTVALSRGAQTVRAHVSADALEDALSSGALTVVLEASEAISPQARGFSDDARALSVAVHRIEVRPSYAFCSAR